MSSNIVVEKKLKEIYNTMINTNTLIRRIISPAGTKYMKRSFLCT